MSSSSSIESPAELTRGEDHPNFTGTTWADAAPGGFISARTEHRFRYWQRSHDLARELAINSGMAFEWARELVSAAQSDLPIIVTWTKRHPDGATSRTVSTVMIEHLGKRYMHIRSWGFSHPIYFGELESVDVPSAEYSFELAPR